MLTSALDEGPALASLREKATSKARARPGSGWEGDVPSTRQRQALAGSGKHTDKRRANLMKQMRLARAHKDAVLQQQQQAQIARANRPNSSAGRRRRRRRGQRQQQGGARPAPSLATTDSTSNLPLTNIMLAKQRGAQSTRMFGSATGKRPTSARIRRSISNPTLGTEDGRPPWRAAGEAFTRVEADKRKLSDSQKTLSGMLPAAHEGPDTHHDLLATAAVSRKKKKKEDADLSPSEMMNALMQPAGGGSSTSSATTAKGARGANLTSEQKAHRRALRIAALKAEKKAKLPSFYSPIEKYHPPKRDYERRTKSYAHELVVASRTPGPKYNIPDKVLRGGVISTAKGKTTIEWIQYYASQIPAPGQYEPVDPMLAASPATIMPDYRGKTELEEIIYRAKLTPGPGLYEVHEPKLRGGVISKGSAKSDVDWAIYRASSIPGPQDYAAPPLPRKGGGCFSNAVVPSTLDVLMHYASQTPSPAEYNTNVLTLPKGGKLNMDTNTKTWLDLIAMRASETPGPSDNKPLRQSLPGGGRFSTANPKDHVETLIYNKREIPGPGKYGNADRAPRQTAGARFNESRPLSEVDILIKKSAEMPAPGDYNPRPVGASEVSQRFSTANPKTDTEWRIYHAKQIPGPGSYKGASESPLPKGGVISASKARSFIDEKIYVASSIPGPKYALPPLRTEKLFGKISSAKPKSNLEVEIARAKGLPGPGQYDIK
jgi:hypothetical protein